MTLPFTGCEDTAGATYGAESLPDRQYRKAGCAREGSRSALRTCGGGASGRWPCPQAPARVPDRSCCRVLRHRWVHVHHNDLREVLGIAPRCEKFGHVQEVRGRGHNGAVVLVGPRAPRLTITTLETVPAQFWVLSVVPLNDEFQQDCDDPAGRCHVRRGRLLMDRVCTQVLLTCEFPPGAHTASRRRGIPVA